MKVVQLPHPVFTREGDNLRTTLNITLREALLGFEKEIEHLDGHKVKVSKKDVTQHGDVLRIREEGMPKYGTPSDFGDLIVTFNVKTPAKLDDGQKAMLK